MQFVSQALLNAIGANVVVLDLEGNILAANDSWRQFAFENAIEWGLLTASSDAGANFFPVDMAGCNEDANAGVRAVMAGDLPNFSLEYACCSPSRKHWFSLSAVPFGPSHASTVIVTQMDITERMQAQEKLRMVEMAIESQDGIFVMDANLNILWVNQAFTKITGLPEKDAVGQTSAILEKYLLPASFYKSVHKEVAHSESWQGETVWRRHESGEEYHVKFTLTKVRDQPAQIPHYVGHLTDTTLSQLHEAQRLLHEAAYRKTLVREVHHRIKNNLQGITGILRQFAEQNPTTIEPMNQAIGQVQSISVIHGLLGRAVASSVRLCELTGAIAEEIENLWQTQVVMDIPPAWLPCVIAEEEAVPIALVLNELILNAVKHGGKAHGQVHITLRKGGEAGVVRVKITNRGQLALDQWPASALHNGLQLVAALMPRTGASISREQVGGIVVTMVQFEPPVIYPESESAT